MYIALIVMTLLIAAVVWIYNRLVSDRNQVLAAWSDIDVQLKRRHDLVPQLVNCVKSYTSFEKAVFTAVTQLRGRSEAASHLPEKAAVEEQVQAGIHDIVVRAEAYPDLKADQNYRQLVGELTEVEDHIQYARRFYNGTVRLFNTRLQSFPHLLVAGPCGFRAAEYFEVQQATERHTPRVELDS